MSLVIQVAAENDDEDANITWTDVTAYIDLRTADQGGEFAVGGEALQGSVGTGSGFDLVDDAGTRVLRGKRVIRAVDTTPTPDAVLFRGRIGDKGFARVSRWFGDAKELDVACVDYNADLGGIIVNQYSRNLEPDWQRILAVQRDYLDGTASRRWPRARASTKLADEPYLSRDNETLVHSITFQAGVNGEPSTPYSVIQDVLSYSEKIFFITVDGEIFFDLATSTAYASTLSITDSSPNLTSSFPPGNARAVESPTEFVSGLIAMGDGVGPYYTRDDAIALLHDKWEESTNFRTAVQAKLEAQTRRALGIRKYEDLTYYCTLKLAAADVGKIKYGQTISVRSAAMGLTSATTLRIVRLLWRIAGIGASGVSHYYAELEMKMPRALTVPGGGGGDDDEPHIPPDPDCVPEIVQMGTVADPSVLPASPTPGNTLVLMAGYRTPQDINTLLWTIEATADDPVDSHTDYAAIATRVVQPGDGTSWDMGSQPVGRVIELSGAVEVVDSAILEGTAYADPTEYGGPVTTTGRALVIGLVSYRIFDGDPITVVADGSQTTLVNTAGGAGFDVHPQVHASYLSVEAGTHTLSASPSGTSGGNPGDPHSAGITIAFACAGAGSPDEEPTPPFGQPVVEEIIEGDCETRTFETNYPYIPLSLEVMESDGEGHWVQLAAEETNPALGLFTLLFAPCSTVTEAITLTGLDPADGIYKVLVSGDGRVLTGDSPTTTTVTAGVLRVRYLSAGQAPTDPGDPDPPNPVPDPPVPPAPPAASGSIQAIVDATSTGGTCSIPFGTYTDEDVEFDRAMTVNLASGVRVEGGTWLVTGDDVTINAAGALLRGMGSAVFQDGGVAVGGERFHWNGGRLMEAEYSAFKIWIGAHDAVIEPDEVDHCGGPGAVAFQADDVTWRGRYHHNDQDLGALSGGLGNESGGIKCFDCDGHVFDTVTADYNRGRGLWVDYCSNMTFTAPRVHHNGEMGIQVEITNGATITGGASYENAWDVTDADPWGSNVLLASCSNVTVTGHVSAWAQTCYGFVTQDRDPPYAIPQTGNTVSGKAAVSASYDEDGTGAFGGGGSCSFAGVTTASLAELTAAGIPTTPEPGH